MSDDKERDGRSEWEKRRHPNGHDLYTPLGPQVRELLWRMHDEHGTWREVSALSAIRLKIIRNIRRDMNRRAISMTMLDRLITATGVGSLEEFQWFTANDLVRLGIWKPNCYVEGRKRIHGENVYLSDGKKKGKKGVSTKKTSKDRQKGKKVSKRRSDVPFWEMPPFPYRK